MWIEKQLPFAQILNAFVSHTGSFKPINAAIVFAVVLCFGCLDYSNAQETVPMNGALSTTASFYWMPGTEKMDYPWTCKCDHADMQTLLQNEGMSVFYADFYSVKIIFYF